MKLSLTVEADAINVLALNMGRIAIDIDGIELADLINVVCDNGYSLRVADSPGKPGSHIPGAIPSTEKRYLWVQFLAGKRSPRPLKQITTSIKTTLQSPCSNN